MTDRFQRTLTPSRRFPTVHLSKIELVAIGSSPSRPAPTTKAPQIRASQPERAMVVKVLGLSSRLPATHPDGTGDSQPRRSTSLTREIKAYPLMDVKRRVRWDQAARLLSGSMPALSIVNHLQTQSLIGFPSAKPTAFVCIQDRFACGKPPQITIIFSCHGRGRCREGRSFRCTG